MNSVSDDSGEDSMESPRTKESEKKDDHLTTNDKNKTIILT